ncbi:MAG: helix-turn-helix transcriptional regulator [Verrucomicrobiia bacterium]|jgi:transcriptional regulator with XRE-family HTH domain
MSDFADNLRVLMAKRGWNQQETAKAIAVSQANISRWLSEGHEPSADVLIRIARVFGVSLDQLLRAPGPALRLSRAEFDTAVWTARWFRQLRLTWQRAPEERYRIETALELAWPNQKPDIIEWLNKK